MEKDRLEDVLNKLAGESVPDDVHSIAEERTKQFMAAKANEPKAVLWRIIMKSRITKFAAAAAVLVCVVGLFIGVFHAGASPAWSMEQTIDALDNVTSVYMKGTSSVFGTGKNSCVVWATASEDGKTSKQLRLEIPGQYTIVNNGTVTYKYLIDQNEVYKEGPGNIKINPWLGKEFFEEMKKDSKQWTVSWDIDEDTGKRLIFVKSIETTGGHASFWFAIDPMTNLPVKIKQWSNNRFEGEPDLNFSEIVYNPVLPEGIFNFQMPPNVKLLNRDDGGSSFRDLVNDPNKGMEVSGLEQEAACTKIISEYLQAVIKQDWAQVDKLRSSGANDAELYKHLYTTRTCIKEIVGISAGHEQRGCTGGLITDATVRLTDGSVRTISYIVAFRETNGQQWCVIIGTWGNVAEF